MNTGDTSQIRGHIAPLTIDHRLQYLLDNIVQQHPTDVACICIQHPLESSQLLILAQHNYLIEPANIQSTIFKWLLTYLNKVTKNSSTDIFTNPIADKFNNALCVPFIVSTERYGAVILLSRDSHAYTQNNIQHIEIPIKIVQNIVENEYLVERLLSSEAIAVTAQAIAKNPTPANIITILRDYLFEPHISMCAIAFYDPLQQNNGNHTDNYLEVVGTWSRNKENDSSIGTKLELATFKKWIVDDPDDYHVISPVEGFIGEQPDNLQRVLRNNDIQTIVILPLHDRERKLGILLIAADAEQQFTYQELRNYQIVSRFLTMSTLSEALSQQTNVIQQGRAAILDAVTDAVVLVLPNDAATVFTVNNRFTQMFDLDNKPILNMTWWDVLDYTAIPKTTKIEMQDGWHIRQSRIHNKTDQIIPSEFTLTDSWNNKRIIQWYSAPVDMDNRLLGYIYTFQDITSERIGERLRNDLLSRVSHELRTPLTAISGFAEFVLEESGDELPDLAREYTEIILNSARHLNSVFTDMIEFSRANSGGIELYLNDAQVQDIIIEVVARLEFQYKARRQTIIMNLDDDIAPQPIDIDRMNQIITNLLSNAIKYAPEDSTINITLEAIQFPDTLPEETPHNVVPPVLLISVADEGDGVEKSETEKIFLPFYRAKSADAQQIEGAGLGLAIAKSLVELHRGRIWARPLSDEIKGGCFHFTIPMKN